MSAEKDQCIGITKQTVHDSKPNVLYFVFCVSQNNNLQNKSCLLIASKWFPEYLLLRVVTDLKWVEYEVSEAS